MSITAIIADDEPLVRRSVRRFLKEYDINVLEECGDGAATIAALRARKPDILFLDMEMPLAKGMQVMAEIGEQNMPTTIILTAHKDYALGAFDFNVADYILKPFGKDRFARGLSRAMIRNSGAARTSASAAAGGQEAPNAGPMPTRRSFPEHIPIPGRYGRISLVKTRDIEWVEAEENLLMIHCGARLYELRETMSAFQARLDPGVFCRIHRSTLVNVCYIQEIRPWCNGHHVVVLQSGLQLRMSRYQRESVERLTNLSARSGE